MNNRARICKSRPAFGGLLAAIVLLAGIAHADVLTNKVVMTNNATMDYSPHWQLQHGFASRSADLGMGYVSGSGDGWYDTGASLSITGCPVSEDYAFVGWSGDTNSAANPLNLILDSPLTNLVAAFAEKTTTNGVRLTWLTAHGITNKQDSVESENPDNDPYDNLAEWISDTDPTNEASYFPPLTIQGTTSAVLDIPATSTGRVYSIWAVTNLPAGTWDEKTNSRGSGTNLMFDMPMDKAAEFFRSGVRLPE